jgi:hypothetical protein
MLPFAVVVYNPLARAVDTPIRIPVSFAGIVVVDASGKNVTSDVIPSDAYDVSVGGQPYNLVFVAESLPALGFSTFFVMATSEEETAIATDAARVVSKKRRRALRGHVDALASGSEGTTATISNGHVSVTVDTTTGLLTSMASNGLTIALQQGEYHAWCVRVPTLGRIRPNDDDTADWFWYNSSVSGKGWGHQQPHDSQNSGAYVSAVVAVCCILVSVSAFDSR